MCGFHFTLNFDNEMKQNLVPHATRYNLLFYRRSWSYSLFYMMLVLSSQYSLLSINNILYHLFGDVKCLTNLRQYLYTLTLSDCYELAECSY